MKDNETQLVKACLSWLTANGILAWRQNTGAMTASYKGKRRFVRFGRPGMSDIAGVLPGGRAFYVECKMPGRVVTEGQWEFLCQVEEEGGLGVVVHTLEELASALRSYVAS